MRDVQAQIVGQITSTPTSRGGQKFTIPLVGPNGPMSPSCFDLALATKAQQTGGQVATFRIEEKPNPRGGSPYLNLVDVAGGGEQLAPILAQPGTPVSFGASPAPAAGAISIVQGAPRTGGGGGMSAEDKIRVTKLSCISSACALFSGSGDVEAALAAAQTIFQGVMQPAQATQEAAPAAVTPEALALAAQQAGAPVQVGTAGVAPAAEPAALPWS